MPKYYCTSCGNVLFFKKVFEGIVSIPIETGESEEEDCDVYSLKDLEFREIYHTHIECAECQGTDIEEEALESDRDDTFFSEDKDDY